MSSSHNFPETCSPGLPQQARLLVVEDEGIVAMHMESRLASLGYRVIGLAATGEQAIEVASQHRPDLVLMDIGLRGEMDGVTAATWITENLGVPVVFLTAYSDGETLARVQSLPPYGYVLKPCRNETLQSVIERALSRYRSPF